MLSLVSSMRSLPHFTILSFAFSDIIAHQEDAALRLLTRVGMSVRCLFKG